MIGEPTRFQSTGNRQNVFVQVLWRFPNPQLGQAPLLKSALTSMKRVTAMQSETLVLSSLCIGAFLLSGILATAAVVYMLVKGKSSGKG